MKVTLITVCRNVAPVIAETLDSVLAQVHPRIEMIVIDGASTDGTVDILNGYRHRIDVLVSEPDKGIYDAMNKGLERATGDVIGFVNAGDLLMDPEVIGAVVDAFERSGADAVYGDIIMVDEADITQVKRTWKSGAYSRSNFSMWRHSSAGPRMMRMATSIRTCASLRIMRSSSACCTSIAWRPSTCRRSWCGSGWEA